MTLALEIDFCGGFFTVVLINNQCVFSNVLYQYCFNILLSITFYFCFFQNGTSTNPFQAPKDIKIISKRSEPYYTTTALIGVRKNTSHFCLRKYDKILRIYTQRYKTKINILKSTNNQNMYLFNNYRSI